MIKPDKHVLPTCCLFQQLIGKCQYYYFIDDLLIKNKKGKNAREKWPAEGDQELEVNFSKRIDFKQFSQSQILGKNKFGQKILSDKDFSF